MTEDKVTMNETELLAYVDGKLGESEREEMLRYLTKNPDEARKVETWRRQNSALQALYGHVSSEDVPLRLNIREIERTFQSRWTEWRALAAVAIVIMALGLAGGWFGRGILLPHAALPGQLVAEATQAHKLYTSEMIHPVDVRADDANHLRSWLSNRLDRPLNIPDLKEYGFSLVGGRLLPNADGAAAQIMYEDQTGRRVTLYIVPAKNQLETPIKQATVDKLEALSWNDETISCAVVGDLPAQRMRIVADATYKQLS